MSSSIFDRNFNNNYINNLEILSNKNTNDGQINNKKNLDNIFSINSEFKLSINNKSNNNFIAGDRYIPLKNKMDNNEQNFILTSSPFNINSLNSSEKADSLSFSDGKIEKNYVNFIIDNMLKISSDKFTIKNEEIKQNRILSFSKRIYNTIDKNKIRRNLSNNFGDIDMNKTNFLTLSEKHRKKSNDFNNLQISNIDVEDELYSRISKLYKEKEKNIITSNNNFMKLESKYNNSCRKIPKIPYRILDAPNLIDDYYLNLLDWGKENIIAIALSDEIYLWNDNNSRSSLLVSYEQGNYSSDENSNYITSLSWMQNGLYLGVGLSKGYIQLWDINKKIKLKDIEAHNKRVSCLAWNHNILSSGSKDRYIKNFDIRLKTPEISFIKKHRQEICSLKYSLEGDLLASGGNDNIAYIWDIRNLKNNILNLLFDSNSKNLYEAKPYSINNFHQAAVKAMSWCPWKRHVLATGGGCKDKTIKIFSCDSNKLTRNIDTGSQVCALLWNEKEKEIISSHGYNKNQIIIWNYEKNKKICELKGHMNRVLYMTMSPDKNSICTGSGDETLRFWKINDDIKNKNFKDQNNMINNVLIH